MKEITVTTWEEFQLRITRDLPQESLTLLQTNCPNDWQELQAKGILENNFLYRGQGGATWKLSTTLERKSKNPDYCVIGYIELISKVWDEFKSQFPNEGPNGQVDIIGLKQDLARRGEGHWNFYLPNEIYEIMATLRHFGFPSPLLDWTNTQDVAAYFAFSNSNSEDPVSIFVYLEKPLGIKRGSAMGPYIISTSNPEKIMPRPIVRHMNQKAEHTLCIKKDSGKFYFCSHEGLPDMSSDHCDLLWKFNIPQDERMKVLDQLRNKGISDSTLYATPDQLVKELTLKYF